MPTRRTLLAFAGLLAALLAMLPPPRSGGICPRPTRTGPRDQAPQAQPIGYDISYPQCGKPFPSTRLSGSWA